MTLTLLTVMAVGLTLSQSSEQPLGHTLAVVLMILIPLMLLLNR